jgi:probable phosphoglycerate mutase
MALAARLLLMDRPAAVVVSPFRRCGQTVQPFLEATGDHAEVQEDLGEVFIGAWEGLAFEEIISGDEELARRFREQEAMFSLAPGGESGAELRARVIPAIERIIEPVQDGVVVVVTHGGVINAYLGHVLGIGHDMFFLPDHASINSVVVDGPRREVRFINDVRHLTDPAVFAPPAGVGEHAEKEEGPGTPGPS